MFRTRSTEMVNRWHHLEMMARGFSGIKMHLEVFMILIRICFSGLSLTGHGRLDLMLDLTVFGIIRGYLIRVRR